MPDVRYVCLSDLHFGAENSILSALCDDGISVDPTRASAALEALVAALRVLVDASEDRTCKPTLILNGDVIELALAQDNVALMVFERFLDLLFPDDGEALFKPTILYQPGNHDHHLWEQARERQYGDYVAQRAPGDPLEIPWHGTQLDYVTDTRPVESELLNHVASRRHPDAGITFRVSYPNLGLRSADGATAIVFHHGHFIESMYQLMTGMKTFVFPGREKPTTVWDMEAENFAWIDFFWSTLGRSGDVGSDVGLIYDMLQRSDAVELLAGNLAQGIAAKLPDTGILGVLHAPAGFVIDRVLRKVATKIAESERKTAGLLSADAQTGLSTYLSGPLLLQMQESIDEHNKQHDEPHEKWPQPEQVKFVFGHTHKPFSASCPVLPRIGNHPVRIFNTGGWVVDTLKAEPLHGANIVLIDENLEIVCVRAYNQSATGDYRVMLDDGLPEEHGPFHARVSALIDPDAEPWKGLSAAAKQLVCDRQKALKKIINRAVKEGHASAPAPG
jgi:hypothetical protein